MRPAVPGDDADVRIATAPQCSSVDIVRGGRTRDVSARVGQIDTGGGKDATRLYNLEGSVGLLAARGESCSY